jgi:hypothetical protein
MIAPTPPPKTIFPHILPLARDTAFTKPSCIPAFLQVIEEQFVKKVEVKKKEPFIFKTEPYRKDYSRYVYWCNPFEPINKGKLGTTQGWRKEEKFPQYY